MTVARVKSLMRIYLVQSRVKREEILKLPVGDVEAIAKCVYSNPQDVNDGTKVLQEYCKNTDIPGVCSEVDPQFHHVCQMLCFISRLGGE